MDCIYIAPLSKALYNLCLSITHSHTHSHTNSDWLPCKTLTSSSGAIGGELSCSGTLGHTHWKEPEAIGTAEELWFSKILGATYQLIFLGKLTCSFIAFEHLLSDTWGRGRIIGHLNTKVSMSYLFRGVARRFPLKSYSYKKYTY